MHVVSYGVMPLTRSSSQSSMAAVGRIETIPRTMKPHVIPQFFRKLIKNSKGHFAPLTMACRFAIQRTVGHGLACSVSYLVVVTNAVGSIDSEAATLTVDKASCVSPPLGLV